MPKQSAGILVYRIYKNTPEVFLAHPGGPFYKNKDLGSWSIPKGEFENDEDRLIAAKREFKEETGQQIDGEFIPLKPVKYKNGKIIYAWMVKGNVDETKVKSNLFPLEFPPKSGKFIDVPEIDRGAWFTIEEAKKKILAQQLPLINEFEEKVKAEIKDKME
jgi:predicted NUDIX family NTP pyrophosphohydrolase